MRSQAACPLLAFGLLLSALAPPVVAQEPDPGRLTIVVLVVDSLMPEELGQTAPATPTLTSLRDAGTSYAESRAVFSAETIPNHVSMMTGVHPDRSGIPTNTYWNRSGAPEERDLSLPSELEATTLFTRIHEACPQLATAAALSKNYLYEVFSECGYSGIDCGINDAPQVSFDPAADPTYIEPSGHTPDPTTMREARAYLPDADFLFVNLGDVDRSGHIDATGAVGPPAARYAALADTDTLVGQLVSDLEAAGRWERTVMLVVSDHGMDWSLATDYVNLTPELEAGVFAIQAGGTGSIYVVDPLDPERDRKLADARSTALSNPGVAAAWYREPNSLDPGEETLLPAHLAARHENFGDLVVMAADGWRISEPDPTSNPLPGNHGHETTLHNTFVVGGGLATVRTQVVGDPGGNAGHFERLEEQSENTDVAATVGWLLGLDVADMDGRPLVEAFSWPRAPSACGQITDSDGDGEPDYADTCPLHAGAADCVCPPLASGDCAESSSAKIVVRGDDKPSLKLRWNGVAGDASALGDPTSADAAGLCVYAGDGAPLASLRLPAGGKWSRAAGGTLRYKDRERSPDGVSSALVRAGERGRIRAKAAGTNFAPPQIDDTDLPLRVQLHSTTGECWQATFDAGDVRRGDTRFSATSGS